MEEWGSTGIHGDLWGEERVRQVLGGRWRSRDPLGLPRLMVTVCISSVVLGYLRPCFIRALSWGRLGSVPAKAVVRRPCRVAPGGGSCRRAGGPTRSRPQSEGRTRLSPGLSPCPWSTSSLWVWARQRCCCRCAGAGVVSGVKKLV